MFDFSWNKNNDTVDENEIATEELLQRLNWRSIRGGDCGNACDYSWRRRNKESKSGEAYENSETIRVDV